MTPNQKLSASIPAVQPSHAILPLEHRPYSDPNRLAPEDAFSVHSPPKRREVGIGVNGAAGGYKEGIGVVGGGAGGGGPGPGNGEIGLSRNGTVVRRPRSRGGRSKGVWKRLLWIKQAGCKYAGYDNSLPYAAGPLG
jgi:phosphatidylinositol glycan class C protein